MKKELEIGLIRTDGGTQTRDGVSSKTVAEYTEAMVEGAEFPPILVFKDEDGVLWLVDGFHRTFAAKEAGFGTIKALVEEGSRMDAVWRSCAANQSHGLRRSNNDKRKVVETVLSVDDWRKMSDRAIAEHCGVSNDFVGKVRRKSFPESVEGRTGRDGKKYPGNGSPVQLWDAENPNLVEGSEPAWIDDDEPVLSDDDWDDAEADKAKGKALAYLKSADKSFAALQDNLSLASRNGALVASLEREFKAIHACIETGRKSL